MDRSGSGSQVRLIEYSKDNEKPMISNRVAPDRGKTAETIINPITRLDQVTNDQLIEKSSKISINSSGMFRDRSWKFWEVGPDDRINPGTECESDKHAPYTKKYLQENSTSRDFLESISYIIPLKGTSHDLILYRSVCGQKLCRLSRGFQIRICFDWDSEFWTSIPLRRVLPDTGVVRRRLASLWKGPQV